MDIETILRQPSAANRPPLRREPEIKHTGGSCKCLCHTDDARKLMALGLALFGGFSYLLGVLIGTKTPQRL